ncbi:SpoIIE family protein phosphatase [Micromonospora sp. KC213]|uniref:ATP-binding SpoIIE family protein phosphatase n=1 Tax=Micromonospora sp. KC213 TaxID=2530378 RepID=UPI00104C0DCB|nr:SpoIIE family protein phosphatase [Micromonospora sp. KC213]TDC41931.1 PAS domain-containing protein [Micromonospora sp. KC213]
MSGDLPGIAPSADVLALLDSDPHGCAMAAAVRDQDAVIVDFRLVYLNEAGGRFLGRPREELIGRGYRELWPDTVTDGTLPFYRRVVQERVPAVRTVYYDRASVTGHFEFRVVPFGDGFIARFVDLSKLTMGAQTEGGTRLYEALDAAFDGFALLRAVRDDDGTIAAFTREYVNQIGAKVAGRTVEELVGHRVSETSASSTELGLLPFFRQVADGGEPWQQQLTSPTTGQVWELKVTRVDVDVVAVSYRDVTEQVGHQLQLESIAAQVRAAATRTAALQTVTAALVAASTPEQVYDALGEVVRSSAGGNSLAVLLTEQDRLVLRYHAGYEDHVVAALRALPLSHPYPATGVSTTGQPRYLGSPEEFARAQFDTRAAVPGGGRAAWAFLPLSTGGQVLGALVIGYPRPRQFDEDERENLIAFSRLAAQALQRAFLFQAQLSIAADLQRALLPTALPTLRGARHAVRYLPWTQGADIGGDWYDVIQIDPDTAAVVIGDVAGHSPQAAAMMGQLRNAIRAYAADGHSPTGVMRRVNELLLRFEPHAMATCCYLELHLTEGTATAVLAGHPPPVLRVDGHARCLPLRTGPPLGVRGAHYHDSTFLLPSGCSLVLYTDGLVEDRRYPLDQGLTDLLAALDSAPTDNPEDLVEHLVKADIGPYPRRDDVAILALTVTAAPPPGPRTARRRFRGDATSTSAARHFADDILAAWDQHPLREDAGLILGEVIANAVQHTAGDVEVRITMGQRLRIDVHDSSNRRPVKRSIDSSSDTGRGMHIIERLAHAWGSAPLPGTGKTVWFELCPPEQRA